MRTDKPAIYGYTPAVIAKSLPGNNAILKLSDIEARGVSVGLEISGGTQEDAAARYAIYVRIGHHQK